MGVYTKSYWTTEAWENGPEQDEKPLYIFTKGPKGVNVQVFKPEDQLESFDEFLLTDEAAIHTFEGFALACHQYTEDKLAQQLDVSIKYEADPVYIQFDEGE